jgi:myosin tail region-interacting protein MTI1
MIVILFSALFLIGNEDGLSDDDRIHKVPMEESARELSSPPPPPHYQQAEAAPVRQLPDPLLRPPVPGSARPHVQVQQYGRHDAEEEHHPHHATRYLPPLSRLPDPPISHEESPLPPARPAQPPRRIVPQAPEEQEREEEEEEEEAGSDDDVVPSHLFVRPPRDQHPVRTGRHYEADDGDSSDNDAPALPVLQRRSVDSIPPPPPPPAVHYLPTSPSDSYEHNSDHDGQELPVPPRHTAVSPTAPPVLLRPTPRRSVPSAPENEESFSSYVTPLVAVSEPEPGEVLDDEEGGKCLFSVLNCY